jgi:DNA-binding transcriptional MocR family regulator
MIRSAERTSDTSCVLADSLGRLASNFDALRSASQPIAPNGSARARELCAIGLKRGDWTPDPLALLFTGTAKQAISATFAGVAPPRSRIGFESLTFAAARIIALGQGLVPVPLEMDEEGVIPQSIAEHHEQEPLHAIYIQPTLQHPLGNTMSSKRKQAIADTIQKLNIVAIEDTVFAFMNDSPLAPLSSYAPDHTIVIDSLSKRASPGITIGFVISPRRLFDVLYQSVLTTAVTASGLGLEIAIQLFSDGAIGRLEDLRRENIQRREASLRSEINGLRTYHCPNSHFLWLEYSNNSLSQGSAATDPMLRYINEHCDLRDLPVSTIGRFAAHPHDVSRYGQWLWLSIAYAPVENIRALIETVSALRLASSQSAIRFPWEHV